MDYALTTQGLTKTYAQTKALNGLTMHVPKGAIYGFVGKNGVGKPPSSVWSAACRPPQRGTTPSTGVPHRAGDPQGPPPDGGGGRPPRYLDLTAADNLKLQYRLLGLPSEEGSQNCSTWWGWGIWGKKKARHFSCASGWALPWPRVGTRTFILDEPINGLDPQGIIEMRELILRLNREHQITVLISSHILDELARLATHYGFLDRGTLVQEISAQELEAACRKCTRLTVTNAAALCQVLDRQGIEYRLAGEGEVDVYGEGNLTQLILDLSQAGCQVTGLHQRDESLESYYMNLIGG